MEVSALLLARLRRRSAPSGARLSALAGAVLIGVAPPAAAQPGGCDSWEFVPSPDGVTEPPRFASNVLYGAGGRGPRDVWAVGTHDDGPGPTLTLALHWDGAAWTITPTPNPDASRNVLKDVDAAAADEAWAVGSFDNVAEAMVLRWDGSSWAIFEAGLPERSSLEGIHALAADDIWAIGWIPGLSIAAHWNGERWQVFEIPQAGAMGNRMQDVSATGPDDVWAAGYSTNGSGSFEPIAAHWDGDSWESMLVPTFGPFSSLYGVAAAAPEDVWAVGNYFDLAEGAQPLIVRWNGESWTAVDLPPLAGGPAELRGVTALARDEVYAVGTAADASGEPRPLIMRFDGASWAVIDPPQTDGGAEWFRGAASIPGGGAWAVGQYFNREYTGTLTAHLPGDCCYADCDQSGGLDFFDFLCFQNRFAAGAPEADCDGSGSPDFFDFLCFQNEFAAGCLSEPRAARDGRHPAPRLRRAPDAESREGDSTW